MDDSFRDTLYTVDKHGNRKYVYPASVKGRFFERRRAVTYPLMLLYLILPWLIIGGEQAVLLDIPGRRFVLFGSIFWASDTFYFVLLLAILGLSLFFFTSLFGRVWCGWACPETVFLEFLFRPLEQLIDGNATAQARLAAQPWNGEKIIKRVLKFLIFGICSWIIASTFVAYFVGADKLIDMIGHSPQLHPVPFALTVIIMALMLFQFGWFREQFCTVLCPYARFQSVLMDANSLTVGYDTCRGEPRGKLRDSEQQQLGDCIDCKLCVRVCPTGIDIRNGLQLECIACAACVDACDSIMDQIGRPRGLIRYATENVLLGKPARWLRPRVIVYSVILCLFVGVLINRLSTRQLTEAQVVRAVADKPYTELSTGLISNHLTVHLSNKSKEQRLFTLSSSADVSLVTPMNPFPVPAESMQSIPVFINFPTSLLVKGKRQIEIVISTDAGEIHNQSLKLIGPDSK